MTLPRHGGIDCKSRCDGTTGRIHTPSLAACDVYFTTEPSLASFELCLQHLSITISIIWEGGGGGGGGGGERTHVWVCKLCCYF